MKVLAFYSHKSGQGVTVAACVAACALAEAGHRVGLVTTSGDTLAALGLPSSDALYAETHRDTLTVVQVAGMAFDALALAELVGLSEMPPRFDVVVLDMGDRTPNRDALAFRGLRDVERVEVVTSAYLALRRSSQTPAEDRQHVLAVLLPEAALTLGDVRQVLNPSGDILGLDWSSRAGRAVDAGLLAQRLDTFDPLAQWARELAERPDRDTLDAADRAPAALKARRSTKAGR